MNRIIAEKYKAFIFDLDGTIYLDNKLIENADIVINEIKRSGKKIVFISNKTTGSAKDYFRLLRTNGIDVDLHEIITSTLVITKYLKKYHSSKNFYAIAERKFISELISAGLSFQQDPDLIDLVIVTLDRKLNYSKLEIAAKAIDKGALFFAANIDNTCPVEGGEILDAGSTISALEKRTNRKLEKYFGKPSKMILDEALAVIKSDIGECLIVGDRLETDIAMGNTFGADTALVNTGVAKSKSDFSKFKPTYKINSVYDLIV